MQKEITAEYLASQGLCPDFETRFWRSVFINTYDKGCWIWVGGLSHKYGYMYKNGKFSQKIRAHVASWILNYGPTNGLCVLHKCDNPPCVRPDHLFLGTRADNVQDCVSKGRARHGHNIGINHGMAKLREEDIKLIRAMYKKRTKFANAPFFAELYGVSSTVIYHIINRKLWNHIG